ncbi:hypothetical protein LENED_003296 [Lentinula edodes]|uniref:Uncharacterized protein n=1 Tax=Lentinula edodes TaxID=5353 RepID=A0A1Q3E3E3_LENED|nr:hypothetical protein LENED_003296 [Lentinula edodes]
MLKPSESDAVKREPTSRRISENLINISFREPLAPSSGYFFATHISHASQSSGIGWNSISRVILRAQGDVPSAVRRPKPRSQ